MDIVKSTKDLANSVGTEVEKGYEVAKEVLGNVVKHLPFANLAKHSNDTWDVEIDLPGVKKEDIELKVEENRLIVNAVRKYKNEVKKENYYLCESSFGEISRSFILPDNVDKEKVGAKYEDGRLYITFEKEESKKAKKITVK